MTTRTTRYALVFGLAVGAAIGSVSAATRFAIDAIDLTPTGAAPPHREGRIFYDSVDKALAVYVDEQDVTMQVGQEAWLPVRNATGATILDGKVVYVSGSQANRATVALARADSTSTCRAIGVSTHDIENATNGYVTTRGAVHNLNTLAFAEGTRLYLSATVAGDLTSTPPVAPNCTILVGTVTKQHVNQGILEVHIAEEVDAAIPGTTNQWEVTATVLRPVADNVEDLGDATHRVGTGFLGSVVLQRLLVTTTPVTLSATGPELVEVDASGGTRTILLPAVATTPVGRRYVVKDNGSAGTNAVTVDANAAELIDGALTFTLTANFASVTVFNNGTRWLVE